MRGTVKGDTQTAYQLACMEVWGGNQKIARGVELPGLDGWIYSAPLEPSSGGGDVCFFSVCDRGLVSRVALADVSGHGRAANSLAQVLLGLMRTYINTWDQSALMRDLDWEFRQHTDDEQYATVVLLSFLRQTRQLLYTSAGHHSLLWYHAAEGKWNCFGDDSLLAQTGAESQPLGLISGTEYRQVTLQLAKGDLLVLYTEWFSEAVDKAGQELGRRRLRDLVGSLPIDAPAAIGIALLEAVRTFRQGAPATDDQTLVILQCRT